MKRYAPPEGYLSKRLYLRLSVWARGHSGYWDVLYCDMAHAVGLPWFELGDARELSRAFLDKALARLAARKLIYLRPSMTLGAVQVWMATNPAKLTAEHGGLYLDRLLGVEQTADPWQTIGGYDGQ
ncbi:hypothetical protein [Bifidobacterium leontopitheci]|uniref:Uncharacterized protein n=1 Tax=Bifidobacterium leontopitheci TaxID=2650774 RepID=A0A6I1GDU8_9BIFI|nr:hypothetical protein [Bifidobacterium leontopitheci]KAB7789814.1 hypothetical protein F7D09_1704 [Bifidobacterium leontopitheci]